MNKNTKRIIAVITIVLLLALIVTIIIFFQNDNKAAKTGEEKWPQKITTKEIAEKYIDNLSDLIINGGTDKEYEEAFGNKQTPKIYIMTGKNSLFRSKPSSKLIKEYNLEAYVDKQEELATNLEKHIKDNFSYNIKGTVEEETYFAVLVNYKSYYYVNYSNDLSAIQLQLLAQAGYNLEENIKENDQFIVDSYKAKIKAASLLDNYLDKYNNSNEDNTTYVRFVNKEKSSSLNELQSYLININGYAYKNNTNLSIVETLTPTINSYTAENALKLN